MKLTDIFKGLNWKGGNNTGVSLSLLAEHARRSDVRCDGVELNEGEHRDWLVITLSVQKPAAKPAKGAI